MSHQNQTIVALRNQLRLLTRDLAAISAGEAGSIFAKGDKARLEARITRLQTILTKLEVAEAKAT